jgi:hypothetical protein
MILGKQRGASHEHPWRTETALQTMLLSESFLNRTEAIERTGQTFNG